MRGDRPLLPTNEAYCSRRGGKFHPKKSIMRGISVPGYGRSDRGRTAAGRLAHRFDAALRRVAVLLALVVVSGLGCADRRPPSPPQAIVEPAREPAPPPGAEPLHVPAVRPGQFRVCGFSFHSPDELAVFRSALSSDDFVFTDLTPVFPDGTEVDGPTLARTKPGWFLDRCRPDLRCDVLVYSGEFAGAFFGSYGHFVTVQEMEEAACRSGCQGLFRHPLEVFLLGCNTLATKNADRRTPEEYRHVLLAHGYSHADAERVVALRYGPLGPSFRESLRRTFMGVPRLYGFSSVAPLGRVTAPRLREYFRRKGDYARYLSRVGRDSAPNKELLAAFAGTGLVQATGVTALEPIGMDRALVCGLYDDEDTVSDRLSIVRRLFARSDFLSFVPNVEVFFNRHPPHEYTGAEQRILAEIQSLEVPRREVADLVYRLDLSVLKMQLANLARQLAWITPTEHDRLAVEDLKQLLAEPLSSEVADIGCELSEYTRAGTELRSEDVPEQLLWHSEGYRLLDCLSPTDPRVSERMLRGLGNIDAATRQWAAYALWRRRPLDDEILVEIAPRLNDSSAEVRYLARRTFKAEAPLSARVLEAVRERDPSLANSLAQEEAP